MAEIIYLTDKNELTDKKHADKYEVYLTDKNGNVIGREYGRVTENRQRKPDFAFTRAGRGKVN